MQEQTYLDRSRYDVSLGIGGAVILLVAVLCYLPSMTHTFAWGDLQSIQGNALLMDATTGEGAGLASLVSFWTLQDTAYRGPLASTLLWVQAHLFGLRGAGYHAVSILLHAAAAIVFWQALQRMRMPGAWIAGLFFVAHPIAVGSVAWIEHQHNILATLFVMLSLLAFVRSQHSDQPKWFALSLGGFIAALLSTPLIAGLPIALAACAWWAADRLTKRDVLRLGIMAAVSLIYTGIIVSIHHETLFALSATRDNDLGGIIKHVARAVPVYLGKIVWPRPLSLLYAPFEYFGPVVGLLVPWVILGSAPWVIWLLRPRLGKGIIAGLVFFLMMILPASGLVHLPHMQFTPISDHCAYLAMAGIIAPLAGMLGYFYEQSRDTSLHAISTALPGALIVSLALGTFFHAGIYKNPRRMWDQVLAVNIDSWLAHREIGKSYLQMGNAIQARDHFRMAVTLNPNDVVSQGNLGAILEIHNQTFEALPHLQRVVDLLPQSADARQNLALAHSRIGQPFIAIEHLRIAAELDPLNPQLRVTMAVMLMQIGDMQEAETQLASALRLNSEHPEANNNMGFLRMVQGHHVMALGYFEKAIRRRPLYGEAHLNRANALVSVNQLEDAERGYRDALRVNPDLADAHSNLGGLLARQGRVDEAIMHYIEALRVRPDHLKAQYNLGLALQAQGKYPEAQYRLLQVLQYDPNFADAYVALGTVYDQMKQPDKSSEQYLRALHLSPTHTMARYKLAYALETQGKLREAIPHFLAALQLNPTDTDTRNHVGALLLDQGLTDPAQHQFEDVLKHDPQNAEAHRQLGRLYLQRNDLDKALTHLYQAVRLNEKNPENLYDLAMVLERQERRTEAIAYYERVLAVQPEHARAHSRIAVLLILQGRQDMALGHLRTAVRSDPNMFDVANALAWLLSTREVVLPADAIEALDLARRICEQTQFQQPEFIDTLAAAHAANSQFSKAIEIAQRAFDVAQKQGNARLAADIEQRLRRYRAGERIKSN